MPPKRKKEKSPEPKDHDISSSEEETADHKKKSKVKKDKESTKSTPKGSAKKQKLITDSLIKDSSPKKPLASVDKLSLPDSEKISADGKAWNFKISSWNVAGIRAWVKKNGVEYINQEQPDIIILQETKCPENKLPGVVHIPDYHTYWVNGEKDGYAGVALYSKIKPLKITKGLGIEQFDSEGRLITAEYEQFYVVGVYVPNAGEKLKTLPKRLEWNEEFHSYLCKLKEKKSVILAGDLNVAHERIDIARPDTNLRSAGFTQEERDGFSDLLRKGFIDSFRHLYPEVAEAYTYWSFRFNCRQKNIGWRLDYFVLSEDFLPNLCDTVIRKDVPGSDHCPITLYVHI